MRRNSNDLKSSKPILNTGPSSFVIGESLHVPYNLLLVLDTAFSLVLLFLGIERFGLARRMMGQSPGLNWILFITILLVGIHFLPRYVESFKYRSLSHWIIRRTFLTQKRWALLLALLNLFLVGVHFRNNPLFLPATYESLNAFAPPQKDWSVQAFYYTIAAWPKSFASKPVFYSLPYEKGPPSHFIGKMIARWDMPYTTLTLEGPKTPGDPSAEQTENQTNPRAKLRDCFSHGIGFVWNQNSCAKVKEVALERHIKSIRSELNHTPQMQGGIEWSLHWFYVQHPKLVFEDQTQGFKLSGRIRTLQGYHAIERWTVVTPGGTHQTFILDSMPSQHQLEAGQGFRQVIGSLRSSDDLAVGRSWANTQLSGIKLDELKNTKNYSTIVSKISDIQLILLSKLSVDPKTLDPYYHLAGTALLLMQKISADSTLKNEDKLAITAVVRPLLRSLEYYSKDIDPNDRRTQAIQKMTLDAMRL